MTRKIRFSKWVRNLVQRLFPIPEDLEGFHGYCEACEKPLMVDDEMKTDNDGVLFCRKCLNDWMESEAEK